MIEKIEKFLKYLENSQKARTILLDLGMAFFIIFLSLLWLDHHKSKFFLPLLGSPTILLVFSVILIYTSRTKTIQKVIYLAIFLKQKSPTGKSAITKNLTPTDKQKIAGYLKKISLISFDLGLVFLFLSIFFFWQKFKTKPNIIIFHNYPLLLFFSIIFFLLSGKKILSNLYMSYENKKNDHNFQLKHAIASFILIILVSFFWLEIKSSGSILDHSLLSFVFIASSLILAWKIYERKKTGMIFLMSLFFLTVVDLIRFGVVNENNTSFVLFENVFYLPVLVFAIITGTLLLLKKKSQVLSAAVNQNEDYQGSSKQCVARNIKDNKKYYVGILALIVFCFFLIKPLLNDFLNGDEWHMYSLAKTISETGQTEIEWNFLHNQPDFHYSSETMPSIYLSLWFKTFEDSILIAHLSSFSIAVLFIVLAFIIIGKIFNKKIAFIFLIYFLTTPFFIWQSIFIRGYIFLFVFLMILYFLLIKIYHEKKPFMITGYITMSSVIILAMKDIRPFMLVMFAPLLAVLLLNIYQQNKQNIPDGIKFELSSVAIIIGSLAIIFIPHFRRYLPYQNFFKEFIGFSWLATDRSIFNFSPGLFKSLMGSMIIFIAILIYKKIPLSKFFLNLSILIFATIILHFIHGYLLGEERLIPRYLLSFVLLNFIVLSATLYIFLRSLINNEKHIFAILGVMILVFNLNFWTTDNVNGWSSGYNYIDIYKQDSYTSVGRIKEKPQVAYEYLLKDLSREKYKKIALVSEYATDPRLAVLSKYKDNIYLYYLREIPYRSKFIKYQAENYSLSDYKDPLTEDALGKIISSHDATFIMYPTRKEYKFRAQERLAVKLGFKKIYSQIMDGNGVEFLLKENN